jgi:hypothetical protein
MEWRPIETFHWRVNEPVLLTDGNVVAHGVWEQCPNPNIAPYWETWHGTPFPDVYDNDDIHWCGYEGVEPFEPTHWAEPLPRP